MTSRAFAIAMADAQFRADRGGMLAAAARLVWMFDGDDLVESLPKATLEALTIETVAAFFERWSQLVEDRVALDLETASVAMADATYRINFGGSKRVMDRAVSDAIVGLTAGVEGILDDAAIANSDTRARLTLAALKAFRDHMTALRAHQAGNA